VFLRPHRGLDARGRTVQEPPDADLNSSARQPANGAHKRRPERIELLPEAAEHAVGEVYERRPEDVDDGLERLDQRDPPP
jgi:hypothetical protein